MQINDDKEKEDAFEDLSTRSTRDSFGAILENFEIVLELSRASNSVQERRAKPGTRWRAIRSEARYRRTRGHTELDVA